MTFRKFVHFFWLPFLCLPSWAQAEKTELNELLKLIDAASHQVVTVRTIDRRTEGDTEFELIGTAASDRILVEARELNGEVFFAEGISDRRAWEMNGANAPVQLVYGRPLEALWRATQWPGHINRWQDLKDKGHRVELLLNDTQIGGKSVYTIRLTLSDGYVRDYFVDHESLRIVGNQDVRRHHAFQKNQQPIRTEYSDFRSIDGVDFAFRTTEVNFETGAVLSSSTTDRIEVNPRVDKATFERKAVGCKDSEGDFADLIERHTLALGGKENIDAIKTLEIALTIEEPGFTISGLYRGTREGLMRIDVFADDERVFSEGFDGQAGWQLLGGETQGVDMSAAGEAAVRHGIFDKFYSWNDYEDLGLSLNFVEREIVDERCYDIVELDYNDGEVTYLYVDAESNLVTRARDYSALHPDANPEKSRMETISSDFRFVDGRVRAFRQVKIDLETGEVIQTTTIDHVAQNIPIDSRLFERP